MLLDASKAFDRVEYVQLFNLLCSRGLCPRVAKVLIYMYTNQCMSVKWNGVNSESFACTNGIKQGGVLSPTLFCVYFNELLCRLESSGFGCYVGHKFIGALGYADDLAILAPTKLSAQFMLNVCEEFARDYKVKFNAAKSVLLLAGRGTESLDCQLKLNNEDLVLKQQANYLLLLVRKALQII